MLAYTWRIQHHRPAVSTAPVPRPPRSPSALHSLCPRLPRPQTWRRKSAAAAPMGPRAADRAAAGPRLPYVIAPPVRRRSHTLAPGRAHAPTKSTHKCRQALLARRPSHQPTALPLQEHPHSHPHPHHGQARRVQLRPQCHSARRPADPGWRYVGCLPIRVLAVSDRGSF